jgi:hypothetical protein
VVRFKSKWTDWTPETPKEPPDKPDTKAIVGAVGSIPAGSQPETPDLSGVVPTRNGSPLQQWAYQVRDERHVVKHAHARA